MNPLLITLTGEEPAQLSGKKKRRPIFSSKGKSIFKKIARGAAWGLNPAAMATYTAAKYAKKALDKKRAKAHAKAARKREEELKRKKAAAAAIAAKNPTPANIAAATSATVKAAAATAAAQTAETAEVKATQAAAAAIPAPGQEPEPEEEQEEGQEEGQEEEGQEESSNEGEQEENAETSGQYYGIVKTPGPVLPNFPSFKEENKAISWVKNNKAQAGILAAALAIGIYYTTKKKK